MYTVTVSFNTTVTQMTEISQRKKKLSCSTSGIERQKHLLAAIDDDVFGHYSLF